MSESAPPPFADRAPEHAAQALTPAVIEQVLADFRGWLADLARAPAELPEPPAEPAPDLHTLLGQFIALRHEVNLQTRAARGQQEQNAETLRQLSEAVQTVEAARTATPDDEQAIRPLLKTLVDVADALALARRELQRSQAAVSESLAQLPDLLADAERPRSDAAPGIWSRWFGGRPARTMPAVQPAELRTQVQRLTNRIDRQLESLITGYNMSLARIERTLQQFGLEPIATVRTPFDPERMEVVEAVENSGRPGGEVVDEVRPGYLWNGRVFRYAQVRVAKP